VGPEGKDVRGRGGERETDCSSIRHRIAAKMKRNLIRELTMQEREKEEQHEVSLAGARKSHRKNVGLIIARHQMQRGGEESTPNDS